MTNSDPIRLLQDASRQVASHVSPGSLAGRVVVIGIDGRKLLDVTVPVTGSAVAGMAMPPIPISGWEERDGRIFFDGERVSVTGRKLDVLRVLIAHDPAGVNELRAAWEGYPAEEKTIRWQIGELRKSLKTAFPDYPDDPLPATGEGYSLRIR
ncbi:MAG: hypothetical protein K8U57_22960 [Planctomycetes bacterium]|nr:hypothetical protein [Planctomycetota bacterium]